MKQKNIIGISIIILFGLGGIIIPIALNAILQIHLPCNFSIIGGPENWLSFWGAYLGGILTASIGFLTLYYNQKNYQDTLQKQTEEKEREYVALRARELEKELIRRVEALTVAPVRRFLLRFPDKISKQEVVSEIQLLKERLEIVELQGLSWSLMTWPDSILSKPKMFDALYLNHIEQFRTIITDVIDLMNNYVSSKDGKSIDDELVQKIKNEIETYSISLSALFATSIKKWIKEETKEPLGDMTAG